MKLSYTLLLLTLMSHILIAQTPFEQIVNAEKKFEKDCLELGIKGGFLANLDSTAIAFSQNGIQNARKYWLSLPDFKGIYTWAPSFGEVSLSGNWGYTTGAVEYRDSSMSDTPSSYMQYTTVWHKNKDGEWKYLIDIGNTHGQVEIDQNATEVKARKVAVRNIKEQTVLEKERQYTAQFKTDAAQAIKTYFSKNFILNKNGYAATTIPDSAVDRLRPTKVNLIYNPVDAILAPSGDMAVVYGNIMRGSTRNFYIRIWRHEPSGWKIALEVVRI